MSDNNDKTRVVYLDYLRMLAMLAVMMMHNVAYNQANVSVSSFEGRVFNGYLSNVYWGVPVFVMISGALFLGRDIEIGKLYKKYILRLFVAYVFWSFLYYLLRTETIDVKGQLLKLVSGGKTTYLIEVMDSHYHMWFVPMIIGLYMLLPVIRQVVLKEKVMNYFLVLSIVFAIVIPQITSGITEYATEGKELYRVTQAFSRKVESLQLRTLSSFVLYFVLGYKMFTTKFEKKIRYLIYSLGIVSFVGVTYLNYKTGIGAGAISTKYCDALGIGVFLQATSLFELFKNIGFKKNRSFVVNMTKWQFGAYLVHALVIETMIRFDFTTLSFNPLFAIPVTTLVTFAVSYLISAVINRIPVANKYIV